jgi:hypothetical protein
MLRHLPLIIFAMTLLISCGNEPTKPSIPTTEQNENGLEPDADVGLSSTSTSLASLPLAPMSRPDLIGFEGNTWSHPQIPPLRFSADGRIAVETKSGGDQLTFRVLVPEKLKKPFY